MLCHEFRSWLIESGSLTLRLQKRYKDFSVKNIQMKNAKPYQGEASLLRLKSHQHEHIRDVLLLGNHEAVVFAHSVIPKKSMRGSWSCLGQLGNKPLGGTLFANPKVTRTAFEYKKLSSHHPIAKGILTQQNVKPNFYWARRSVFQLKRAKILVTEVFLPNILK
jgi:chorismate lyase